eukprot:767736-Hanusia_phi.AAC.2
MSRVCSCKSQHVMRTGKCDEEATGANEHTWSVGQVCARGVRNDGASTNRRRSSARRASAEENARASRCRLTLRRTVKSEWRELRTAYLTLQKCFVPLLVNLGM